MEDANPPVAGRRYRFARTDALIGTAVLSSLVFIWLIAVPALGPEGMARHGGHFPILGAHAVGGVVMLLVGAVALRIGVTRRWFRWHRLAGFIYLASGTVVSASALERSFDVEHTPGLSTGTLAVVWLACAALAVRAIRNRRLDQHREWMIRSYVAAWTFLVNPLWSSVTPDALRGPPGDMGWVTWVAPMLLAEVFLQWRRGSSVREAKPQTRSG